MLLISYLSSYLSPERFWILAFFGLIYSILLIINIFFVLFWIIFGSRNFLYSLIAIAIGFTMIQKHIQFNSRAPESADQEWFKVISYNTRLFDHYNWNHSEESKDRIINYLNKESPDILCLQEFFSDDQDKNPILKELRQDNKAKYTHVDYFLTKQKTKHYGLATFSSYPIIGKGKVQPDNNSNNYTIFTDIIFNKDTIRIYNIHLPSIRFGSDDFSFVSGITKTGRTHSKTEITKGSLSVIRKLKIAFQRRARHVDIIAEHISKSPYPVIVCGDFNDTPSSYAYRRLSDNLVDSFMESGSGLGKTYAGSMPSFRIDYIFHDIEFIGRGFKTSDITFSDHYPISTFLKTNKAPTTDHQSPTTNH